MPNGEAVRIGFGKADSAPVAPAKGNSTTATTGTAQVGANKSTNGVGNGMAGIESQLQSTPTRALWIGSIPSTTTPATILSVFSPYGPIESARVLTHKNCGFSKLSNFATRPSHIYISTQSISRDWTTLYEQGRHSTVETCWVATSAPFASASRKCPSRMVLSQGPLRRARTRLHLFRKVLAISALVQRSMRCSASRALRLSLRISKFSVGR